MIVMSLLLWELSLERNLLLDFMMNLPLPQGELRWLIWCGGPWRDSSADMLHSAYRCHSVYISFMTDEYNPSILFHLESKPHCLLLCSFQFSPDTIPPLDFTVIY